MTASSIIRPIAAALALAAAVGCSREGGEAAPAVPPSSPASYMKDEAFRKKLDAQVEKRGELAAARNAVAARMAEMVEAKKKELGTDDEAKLKAALEKDPEWNELYRRCEDANAAIGENRRKTMATVRERIKSKKEEGRRKK